MKNNNRTREIKIQPVLGGEDINNTKEEKESQRKRTNNTDYIKVEIF